MCLGSVVGSSTSLNWDKVVMGICLAMGNGSDDGGSVLGGVLGVLGVFMLGDKEVR